MKRKRDYIRSTQPRTDTACAIVILSPVDPIEIETRVDACSALVYTQDLIRFN